MSDLNQNAISQSYTEDSINGTNNSIQAVRQDVSRYLGSSGLRAILQMLREIIENSIDEESMLLAKFLMDKSIELWIHVKMYPDGTVTIKDQGRGIPVGLKDIEEDTPQGLSKTKLADFKVDEEGVVWRRDFKGDKQLAEIYLLPDEEYTAYTAPLRESAKWIIAPEYQRRVAPVIIHALENDTFGGKGKKGSTSANDAYKDSRTGGVHGAGMCVTLACCERFDVVNTFRGDSQTYEVKYAKGERVQQFRKLPSPRLDSTGKPDYGYEVTFKPDLTILNLYDNAGRLRDYPYDIKEITELFRNYVMACDRINISLDYQLKEEDEPTHIEFKSADFNTTEMLKKISKTGEVYEHTFKGEDLSDPTNIIDYDLKIDYTLTGISSVRCLVNRLMTSKSSVTTSFINTLTEVLYNKFQVSRTLNPNVPLELELDRYYVGAFLSLGINNPEFSGQVKSEFHNPRLMSMLNVEFHKYFATGEGATFISQLYNTIKPSYSAKVAEYLEAQKNKKKLETKNFKDKASKSTKSNKRTSFPVNTDISQCFLLLVEGDSGAKRTNDALSYCDKIEKRFGTFKLKGKLFNSLVGDITKCDDQEMFEQLFNATGPKYRWKRVVAFTDGDVDGQHIRDLITSWAIIHSPELVLQLRFSILNSPICKLKVKSKNPRGYDEHFVFTYDKVEELTHKYGPEGLNLIIDIQYYKGIAELTNDDFAQLLEIDEHGNLKYEYIIKPTDGSLENEIDILNKYFGRNVSFRKQYIEDNFMTHRYAMYTSTRKERFKDIGINVDLQALSVGASGEYEHADLTDDITQTQFSETNYMTAVDFLINMRDKYGVDMKLIDEANQREDTGDYKL